MKTSTTLPERMRTKIQKSPSGCWIWTGAFNSNGYGHIFTGSDGRATKTQLAHRLIYEMKYGAIPEGMNVCHKCDVPACCNPDHLFVGTQADNLRDMRNKGRNPTSEEISIFAKKAWTPELRAMRAKLTADRMKKIHDEKATEAGVPLDWKFCPDCHEWFPRSGYHKNKARHDGLKCVCKSCDTKQIAAFRLKKKSNNIKHLDRKFELSKLEYSPYSH
jgi:hypothetical protein